MYKMQHRTHAFNFKENKFWIFHITPKKPQYQKKMLWFTTSITTNVDYSNTVWV